MTHSTSMPNPALIYSAVALLALALILTLVGLIHRLQRTRFSRELNRQKLRRGMNVTFVVLALLPLIYAGAITVLKGESSQGEMIAVCTLSVYGLIAFKWLLRTLLRAGLSRGGNEMGLRNATPLASSFSTRAPQAPTLHWAIVLVLSIVTFGLFALFWSLRLAWFARRIDPGNQAPRQLLAAFLVACPVMFLLADAVAKNSRSTNDLKLVVLMGTVSAWGAINGFLNVRTAIQTRYGVQMSAVLAVVLNVCYLQFHLSRVAVQDHAGRASGPSFVRSTT